ncbi:MAG: hypothetical protein KOO62_08905 [candidate division Zixibacteria bacterium]|nr:hypothetical protein [candidate division Zixibacteria bacterium]
MAKKQSFADKAAKRGFTSTCPVCDTELAYIKHVKAVKSENGWKYRSLNVGVCKCNEKEIYG